MNDSGPSSRRGERAYLGLTFVAVVLALRGFSSAFSWWDVLLLVAVAGTTWTCEQAYHRGARTPGRAYVGLASAAVIAWLRTTTDHPRWDDVIAVVAIAAFVAVVEVRYHHQGRKVPVTG